MLTNVDPQPNKPKGETPAETPATAGGGRRAEPVVTSMAEIEALRAKSLAERTPAQDALEAIGEAASALEHESPTKWSPTAVARLRRAADLLRRAAQDEALLDALADWCCDGASGRDVLFRRSDNPERWTSDAGDYDVIEIRHWGDEQHDTVREALQRAIEAAALPGGADGGR